MNLENMTQARWNALSPRERDALRDTSNLSPQLAPYEGDRVEVVTDYGETRRFWVGRSTGWRPCHIEVHNARSRGGPSAEKSYRSVRLIRRGPRR